MDHFEQYKKHTSDQIKELQEHLGLMSSKMNEIIKAINDLEQSQKSARQNQSPAPAAPQKFSNAPTPDDGTHTVEPKQEKGSETNQRAGNYTPQDVRIDKIFYY